MSKKLIAVFALAAVLLTSFGVLYNSGVVAANFPAVNSAINDEYIQLGDCNADGVVNAKDVITLKLYLNGLGQVYDLTADANQDGVIDNNDVRHIAQTVATGNTVTVENYPPVKEVPDGTVLYYEDFESRTLSDDSNATAEQLGWTIENTSTGAFDDNTALYSVVSYGSGKALYINNNKSGGTDSYVKLLTDAQMGYFHERNYTVQYDVQYADAADSSRYLSMLLGYSGSKHMYFYLRNGGIGANVVQIDSSRLTVDGGAYASNASAPNSIADKLIGVGYDGTTQLLSGMALSIRYVVDWENGCSVYIRTKDTSTTSGGQWVLVSKLAADSAGASYFNPETFEAALALKTGGKQNGYIDNIILWTGTGDEPADKSAPLLTSGNDECYNHTYVPATCFNVRYCRHCDFTVGKILPHDIVNDVCTMCGKTSEEISAVKEFTSVYPENGASVQLANSTVQNYYNEYSSSFDFTGYPMGEDAYYPDNLTLSWTVSQPANSYKLYVSLNSDMSDSEVYTLTSTSYTHKTLLYGKQYYWYVDAIYSSETVSSDVYTFTTLEGIRAMQIPDVSNTRDIGGWMTSSGLRVKQGMVYRGAALDESRSSVTEEGRLFMINELGIKTDIDMRGETAAGASPLGSDIQVVSAYTPYYDALGNDRTAGSAGPFVDDGSGKYTANLRTVFSAFANSYNYPIYAHCSIGRDRTGTLVFLLNGLLGVSEDDLLKDYYMSMLSSSAGANYEGCKHSINSLVAYFDNFGCQTLQENIEKYLLSIGITQEEIKHIRYNLLESPAPSDDGGSDTLTVSSVSPANGATVQLANDTVQSYYEGFTWRSTFTSTFTHGVDATYFPDNLTFQWTGSDSATSYTLYVSRNADMSDAQVISGLTTTSYEHKTLFYGYTYYWKVAATDGNNTVETAVRSFTTKAGIRTFDIDRVSNTRDIGGYTTVDGYRVKQGMAYRGAAIDAGGTWLNDTANGRLFMYYDMNIKDGIEIDLRGDTTTGNSRIGSDITVVSASCPYYAGPNQGISSTAAYKSAMKTAVEAFANSYNYPIYFHCQIGCDRTGTLAFLINGLLGVSERDLFMDYEFSKLSWTGGDPNVNASTLTMMQDNIESLYNYLMTFGSDELSENIERYLLSIGVTFETMEHIRYNLLEGYVPDFNGDEIPYDDYDSTIQGPYKYDSCLMMKSAQAATEGVPTGYSGEVFKITGGGAGALGFMVDQSSLNIKRDSLQKIVLRVWCPANVRNIRLKYTSDTSFLYDNASFDTEQWIDIEITDSATLDSLCDSAGYLKSVCLGFRLTDYDITTTVYIDSITYVTN